MKQDKQKGGDSPTFWEIFRNRFKRHRPEITYWNEIWIELRPLRTPIILTVLIMLFGSLGYVAIDNFSLSDAIYQTGITFTTVGFGEIAPISNGGRFFTIFLIILGFAVFSYAVGLIVEVINNGRLINLIKENGMLYRIARLKRHIVIFYHNEFTVALSKELRKAHIPFVVVDENLTENEARQSKYPYYIKDNPNKEVVLKKTHLSSAKGVVTLSPNIAENIAIISSVRLYERELHRTPYYILSISHNREGYNKLKKLGADEVITPTQLTAQRFTALIVDPEVNNILEKFVYSINTPLDLEEIKIPSNSWVIGRQLKEIKLRKRLKISVIGIQRRFKFIPTPDGEERLEKGDILLLIGNSRHMASARKLLTSPVPPKSFLSQSHSNIDKPTSDQPTPNSIADQSEPLQKPNSKDLSQNSSQNILQK